MRFHHDDEFMRFHPSIHRLTSAIGHLRPMTFHGFKRFLDQIVKSIQSTSILQLATDRDLPFSLF